MVWSLWSDGKTMGGPSTPAPHFEVPAGEAAGRVPERLAHDLGNYLAAISGLAQVGRLVPASEAKDKYLTQIEAAALDMSLMVKDSLAPRRVDARELTGADQLRALLDEATGLLSPRYQDKGVLLRLELRPHLPRCMIARAQLKAALVNLLDNALQATAPGGWVVVWAGPSSPRPGLHIRVQDNGVGIPKQDLDRVFMPGYTTRGGGCGIGLSVAREIVEVVHGGRLTLRSRPGAGTTACIYLPC